MILSMTGFGRSVGLYNDKEIVVELKSLNGKQFELNSRLNPLIKAYEVEVRNVLQQRLKRGTIELTVAIKQDNLSKPIHVNTDLAKYYFNSMQQIADELGIAFEHGEALPVIMRMPEVVANDTNTLSEEDWKQIKNIMLDAAEKLLVHRQEEGKHLEKELLSRIDKIESLLEEVLILEPQRLEKIKTRIKTNIEEWVHTEQLDVNRFEQELIYYIEKIDFSEEKVRLKAHCEYFKELVVEKSDDGIGKKLGFVLQEVGREINTLGSKANDAQIQKNVVNMKDELEKAKEQVLNVL